MIVDNITSPNLFLELQLYSKRKNSNNKNINFSFQNNILDCSGNYCSYKHDDYFELSKPFNFKIHQKIFYNDDLNDIKCIASFIFNFRDNFNNFKYKNKNIFYLNILDFDTHNKAIIAKPGFSSNYDDRFTQFRNKSKCNSFPILFFPVRDIHDEERLQDYIKGYKKELFSPFLINRMSLINCIKKLNKKFKDIDIIDNEIINLNNNKKIYDISGNLIYDLSGNIIDCDFDFIQSKETYYFCYDLLKIIFEYRYYIESIDAKNFDRTIMIKDKDIQLNNQQIEIIKLQNEGEKTKIEQNKQQIEILKLQIELEKLKNK